jgi:VanZ family protein
MQMLTRVVLMRNWTLTVFLSIFIFWASIIKTPSIIHSSHWLLGNIDKLIHFVLYAIYSLSLFISFNASKGKCYTSFMISVSYGFFIECMQSFTPYRSFDLYDILFNALGSFSMLFYLHRYKR